MQTMSSAPSRSRCWRRSTPTFPPPPRRAIGSVVYDASNKVAFEAPRFWEKEQIYGGISFVGGDTTLIWYPSAGLHSERGMLLATYTSGRKALDFQTRPLAEQIAAARAAVELVHPGHGADCVDPLVVNWRKVPYSLGPWPAWNGIATGPGQEGHIDKPAYRLLCEPVRARRVRQRGAQPDAGLAGGRGAVSPCRCRDARIAGGGARADRDCGAGCGLMPRSPLSFRLRRVKVPGRQSWSCR